MFVQNVNWATFNSKSSNFSQLQLFKSCNACFCFVFFFDYREAKIFRLTFLKKQGQMKHMMSEMTLAVSVTHIYTYIRLTLVIKLIRKTNTGRFRRPDDMPPSLSRKWFIFLVVTTALPSKRQNLSAPVFLINTHTYTQIILTSLCHSWSVNHWQKICR